METFISSVAQKLGISETVSRKGIRVILGFLEKHSDPTAFSQFINAIPGAADLLAEEEPAAAGGGIMGSVIKNLTMIRGSGSAIEHEAVKLQSVGLQPSQLHPFVVAFASQARTQAGDEIANRVLAPFAAFLNPKEEGLR